MSLIRSFFGRRSDGVFDPFSLDVWYPFEGWPFHYQMRQLSGNVRSNLPSSSSHTASFAYGMVDWRETPDSHVFKADVPGLRKEDVKVILEDDRMLQISGEWNRGMEERRGRWYRVGVSSGCFLRRFRLPENAKLEAVKASMENGVLTVTVPKLDARTPDIKNIEISG